MSGTLVIDDRAFRAAFDGLDRFVQGNKDAFVRDEAKRAVALFVKLTPPKNQAQGRKAVARDVKRVVQTGESGFLKFVEREFGPLNVSQQLRTKAGKSYMIEWDEVSFKATRVLEFHGKKRDRRGRVRPEPQGGSGVWRARGQIVTTERVRRKVIRERQSHVGLARAGWLPAAQALGVPMPGWVTRHSGAHGAAVEFRSLGVFAIEISNQPAARIPGMNRLMGNALAIRARAMESNLLRMFRNGANQYGFA